MLQIEERARHFRNEFALLLAGPPEVRTGARARLLLAELIAAFHLTLGGENLRVVVHVLVDEAVSAAGLSLAMRAETQAWVGVRLVRECALLDLLATAADRGEA